MAECRLKIDIWREMLANTVKLNPDVAIHDIKKFLFEEHYRGLVIKALPEGSNELRHLLAMNPQGLQVKYNGSSKVQIKYPLDLQKTKNGYELTLDDNTTFTFVNGQSISNKVLLAHLLKLRH